MKTSFFRVCLVSAAVIGFTLPQAKAQHPVFSEVSVHDPSVIKTGDTYYVFGSHLASAKSKNLMQWRQMSSSVNPNNPLIPNVYTELKETFDWAQSDTLWAPDVAQLSDGKYYMYYNACKGDSPRSALGVAVSDKIEGPYKNKGIFLKSGMEGKSEDGTTYNANVHPNVVDPQTFFDHKGKLWMVYGSYSGGIFIMEMNPKTGFPLPNQGYGKNCSAEITAESKARTSATIRKRNITICICHSADLTRPAVIICVWRALKIRTVRTMTPQAITCLMPKERRQFL